MPHDLSNYVPVRDRIRAFYERFPRGSIRTELVHFDGDLVIFKAMVYRDPEDPLPTTGWAYERRGAGGAEETTFVENCETSAIGRALANRGFAVGPRPSREEMGKVQRLRRDARARRPASASRDESPREGDPEARIRALLGRLRLSPSKRERIEARLEAGMTTQEFHDLEAYLLALAARAS